MGDPTLYEPGWMSTSKQTLTQYRLLLSPLPSLKIALGHRAPLDPTYFNVGENKSWTESLLSSLDSFEALGDFRIAPNPSSAEKNTDVVSDTNPIFLYYLAELWTK